MRVRKWTDDQFVEAVKNCFSIAQVLRQLKLCTYGGNYKQVHKYLRKFNLCTDHWTGQGHLRGKTHSWTPTQPLNEVLTENSFYSRSSIKRRLLKAGLLTYACANCGLSTWRDQHLVLQLEHKNGNNVDNRLENLCLLCPNCHSQTKTFAGKNIRLQHRKPVPAPGLAPGRLSAEFFENSSATNYDRRAKTSKHCLNCTATIKVSRTGYCVKCKNKFIKTPQPTKINWPSKEELEKVIWQLPTAQLAKQLGVSDSAIAKKCRRLGIPKPPRGYWAKLNKSEGMHRQNSTIGPDVKNLLPSW